MQQNISLNSFNRIIKFSFIFFVAVFIFFAHANFAFAAAISSTGTAGNWNGSDTSAWPLTNRSGNVTASTSSTTVTGSSTTFTTTLMAGNVISTQAGTAIGIVASIQSDTSLTLTANSANNVSGQTWRSNGVGSGDSVTIVSGSTPVMNANSTVSSVTIASPTSANGISISTAKTLTIANALTFTANATVNDQTVTINGTGGLSANSVTANVPTSDGDSLISCDSNAYGTINVSGTVSLTSTSSGGKSGGTGFLLYKCNLTVGGLITLTGGSKGGGWGAQIYANNGGQTGRGIITANAGITFAGTAAQAKLSLISGFTITPILNLTGTMSAGGTVNGGGELVTTGTSAINGAYTFYSATVSSGTLTLGAGTIQFYDLTVADGATLSLGNFAFTSGTTGNTTTVGSGTSGVISVAGAGSTGTYTFGGVTVNAGGTFDLSNGTHATVFSASVTQNSNVAINTGTGASTLTGNLLGTGIGGIDFGGALTIAGSQTSVNNYTGGVVTVSGTMTLTGNWTQGLGDFSPLNQTSREWREMAAAPNGDIYAVANNGGIYERTNGSGDFNVLDGTTPAHWYGMAAAPNGNIYASVGDVSINYAGYTYMQTNGSGSFNLYPSSQSGRLWQGMAAAPNGNIYAANNPISSKDIYMQTNGSGNFNALSQAVVSWTGMAAAPNGNIYASVNGGDIYMQTNGSGNFNALSQTSRSWKGMAADSDGNIYAVDYGGDIYKQTNGSGNFNSMGQTVRYWGGITIAPNGHIYASASDIYEYIPNSITGITLTLSSTTPFSGSGTFDASAYGNTVNYAGAAQTIKAVTYHNLTLSGSGGKTFPAGTTTVNGILSVENGTNANTFSGSLAYGSLATLQYNAGSSNRTVSSEWPATFSGSGGVVIKGTGIISLNAAKVLDTNVDLNINTGATLTPGSNLLTFGGDFINSGTLTSGSGGVTINSSATTQAIAGFTTTGTVSMTKTAGTATFGGNVNGSSLTINGSGGTLNLGTSLTHTFTGDVTLTAGTLNGGSSTIKANNVSATAWGGNGSLFTAGTGTVELGGAGDQTISATASTFYNLKFSDSGTKTITNDATISATGTPLTITGTATVVVNTGQITKYTGNGATATCTGVSYYNLQLYPSSSTAQSICTAGSQTLTVLNNLTAGDGTAGHAGATGATWNPAMNIGGVLTAAANATFTTGTSAITLSSTATPLSITGTFTVTSGNTINYTGNGATVTCTGVSYYDLGLKPGGVTKQTLCTAGSQTLTATNNVTVGDATNSGADGSVYNPAINITGNLSISANAAFTSTSGILTIGGSFTNTPATTTGFAHNNGTIKFNTNSIATITGTTTFYNFNVTGITGTKTVKFATGTTFTFAGPADSFVVTGTGGNLITITSTDTNQWLASFTNTQAAVTYINLSHSGCNSSAIVTLDGTSVDDPTAVANDGNCWMFATVITVSGTTNATDGFIVRVAVDGNIKAQTGTTGTPSTGNWEITSVPVSANKNVVVFLTDGDGDTADTNESTAISKYDGTGDMTGMVLNTNVLSVGSIDNPSLALTDLATYDCTDDEDVMHRVNASVLEVEGQSTCVGTVSNDYNNNESLQIEASDTLTIGSSETLATDNVVINTSGILTGTTTAIFNISGSWDNNSIFNKGTSTVNFTSTTVESVDSTGATTADFNILNFNGAGGSWTLNSALVVAGNLTVSAGTLKNGGNSITGATDKTFSVSNGAFFEMSGISAYPADFSTYTYGATSTVSYLQTNGLTITNAAYGHLNLKPAGATPLVLPGTLSNIAGNLTIGDNANAGATGVASNPSFGVAGVLTIASGATFATGTGTITLSGSGNPLVISGTFTPAVGNTINYTGTSPTNITATIYDNLSFTPGSAATYTLPGSNLTMQGNLSIGANTTITTGAGTIIFAKGGTQTWTDSTSGTQSIGAVQVSVNGTPTTLSTSSNVKATSLAVDTSQNFDITSDTLTLTGSTAPLTLSGSNTFTITGSTVVYAGTGATSITPTTYNNLSFTPASGTPTYTLPDTDITLRGNLLISTGTVVAKSANNKIIFAVGGGGSQTLTGNATNSDLGLMQISENVGNSTLNLGSSVKMTKITIDPSQTLSAGGNTLTFTGSGAGALRPLYNNGGTATVSSATVNFEGTSATDIENTTYNNLGVGTASDVTATTYSLMGTTTVTTTLTIGNAGSTNNDILDTTGSNHALSAGAINITSVGALTANGSTITLTGNSTPLTVSGVFTPGTGTVIYNGSTPTVTATIFNNLTLGGTGTYTMPASNLTLRGDLSITSGADITPGAGTVIFAKTGGGTLTWADNNGTSEDIGPVQVSADGGVTTLSASSNVMATSITVDTSQNLNISSDILELTGTGTPLALGGSNTFTTTNSTVKYSGNGATVTCTGASYNNLNLMPSGVTAQTVCTGASQTLTVGGDLTVGDGANAGATATTNDPAINVTGSVIIGAGATFTSTSGVLTIDNDFTNGGGFVHASGTIAFATAATATITGNATTFNNFSVTGIDAAKIVEFDAGVTYSFDGTFTITGATSQLVTIRSDVADSQWLADFATAQSGTVTYVSLKDSGCSASATVTFDGTSSEVSGNDNSCWVFPISLTQFGYRWRNDNADEANASYPVDENEPLTSGVYIGDQRRLRVGISNTGGGSASNRTYRLEYSSGACSSWAQVPAAGDESGPWVMAASSYISDASATTDSTGLTNPAGKTFAAGIAKTTASQASAHTLSNSQFTELEYSVEPTSNVSTGTTYCFQVTHAGNANGFTYSNQPQIKAHNLVFRSRGGGSAAEAPSASPDPQVGDGSPGGAMDDDTETPAPPDEQGTGGTGGGTGGSSGGDSGFLPGRGPFMLAFVNKAQFEMGGFFRYILFSIF